MKSTLIYIRTLGCAKNQVDSEKIASELVNLGARITPNAARADILILNTCGFIQAAKEESIAEILSLAGGRSKRQKLVMTGCLTQRYKQELIKELPEVDIFFGVYQPLEIAKKLLNYNGPVECPSSRYRGGPGELKHHAYLKIAEGCNRRCGFCAIPNIRGPQVSRPIKQIVEEAQWLESQGVMEVSLIAQDLTSYTQPGGCSLSTLVHAIIKETRIPWIRLMYAYPASIEDSLLDLLACEPRLCRYLDLPVQHISTSVLRAMRRGYTGRSLRAILNRVRQAVPGIVLRTTMLVGYPGETADDFKALMDFVQEFRFHHLGAFAYSHEEGTYAYRQLGESRIRPSTARHRLGKLMAAQQAISSAYNEQYLGSNLEVLVDKKNPDFNDYKFIGRTAGNAPGVDGEVLIRGRGATPGTFRQVAINGAWEFDLAGDLLPLPRQTEQR
jgi:ribosomal protein S12 methylthiotransferase